MREAFKTACTRIEPGSARALEKDRGRHSCLLPLGIDVFGPSEVTATEVPRKDLYDGAR
jgi:hypothetical protein